MNQSIKVEIPKDSNIPKKIKDTYSKYYKEWRLENPFSKAYSITRLKQNIKNVLSVNGRVLNDRYFQNSTYAPWRGRKVLLYYHWYFLVRFQQNLFGEVTAIIEDAVYEGDYHNDKKETKPYGENLLKVTSNFIMENKKYGKVIRLTETQFKEMLIECITKIIKEIA